MSAMAFGRKRKEAAPQQQPTTQSAPQSGTPWQSYGSGGYQVTELPYYDKGKRKVMVYRSDASGKIIKTFKK
jgi:hypothetical protein